MSKMQSIRIGQRWRGVHRRHKNWVVEVLRVSATKVYVECLAGPGQSHGRRLRLNRAHFLQGYRPDSAVRR